MMIAMTIAGMDPSGGAGILNDIKTFHSMGVYGTGIVTVLTAQNHKRVESIETVSLEFIRKQFETVLEEYPVEYAKTGMLYSIENVELVSCLVKKHDMKVVVDPVMVAGSGAQLSVDGYAKSLKEHLLQCAVLTTPNVKEAETLSGISIVNVDDAVEAADKIGELCDVVITGGDLGGSCVVNLDGNIHVVEAELVESENTHGTGCSFSAAITACLVKGYDHVHSIEMAVDYVRDAVVNGKWGTLNQFHRYKI